MLQYKHTSLLGRLVSIDLQSCSQMTTLSRPNIAFQLPVVRTTRFLSAAQIAHKQEANFSESTSKEFQAYFEDTRTHKRTHTHCPDLFPVWTLLWGQDPLTGGKAGISVTSGRSDALWSFGPLLGYVTLTWVTWSESVPLSLPALWLAGIFPPV